MIAIVQHQLGLKIKGLKKESDAVGSNTKMRNIFKKFGKEVIQKTIPTETTKPKESTVESNDKVPMITTNIKDANDIINSKRAENDSLRKELETKRMSLKELREYKEKFYSDMETLENNKEGQTETKPLNTRFVVSTNREMQGEEISDSGQVTFRTLSEFEGRNISKSIPVYFVEQGYFLCWEGNKCWYQSESVSNKIVNDIPSVLMKNANITTQKYTATSKFQSVSFNPERAGLVNISKQEYDNLVAQKPTRDSLFRVYSLAINNEEYEMDLSKAQPLF